MDFELPLEYTFRHQLKRPGPVHYRGKVLGEGAEEATRDMNPLRDELGLVPLARNLVDVAQPWAGDDPRPYFPAR